MKAFETFRGRVAPLDRANVDTDQIIPKQFLKSITRSGLGKGLFFDWRLRPDGTENPDFSLNQPRYRGASVLVARQNFGCGSSREHAPWALMDIGFRALVAPSFADIFYNNCFKNGLLPVALDESAVDEIFKKVQAEEGFQLTVNLGNQTLTDGTGGTWKFQIHPFRKKCLVEGLDDISLTLQQEEKITAYEARR